MASAFAHAVVAVSLGSVLVRPRWLWAVGAACAVLPDADVIGFVFGVGYGDLLGHRGLSHSLPFALLLATLVHLATRRFVDRAARGRLWWFLFLATASHGALDALTDGGLGVAFLAPFSDARSFFPWRPIAVSPISVSRFFSARGLAVIRSELLWIGIPAAALFALGWWRERVTSPRPASTSGRAPRGDRGSA